MAAPNNLPEPLHREELYWELREIFPNVKPSYIRTINAQTLEEAVNVILGGSAPEGSDSEEEEELEEAVVRSQQPERSASAGTNSSDGDVIIPAFLFGVAVSQSDVETSPPTQETVHGVRVGPTSAPSAVVKPSLSSHNDASMAVPQSWEVLQCRSCDSAAETVECAPVLVGGAGKETHRICGACLRLRFLFGTLRPLSTADALLCPIRDCSNILSRGDLSTLLGHPWLAAYMTGNNNPPASFRISSNDEPPKDELDEEMNDSELAELESNLQYADKTVFKQLCEMYPNISEAFLAKHADRGINGFMDLIKETDSPVPRRRKRKIANGDILAKLSSEGQFDCLICYNSFDRMLALFCSHDSTAAVAEEGRADGDNDAPTQQQERHLFCADCIKNYAASAETEPVLVRAGLGLRCMQPSCEGTLLRAHIEQVLDNATRAIIDPLLDKEAVLAAALVTEKCTKCPYTVIIEDDQDAQPVFYCAECGHQFCRSCKRIWDENHASRKCEELDPEFVRRKVEEQLTSAVLPKCARCQTSYQKTEGCNKIVCRCGAFNCYVCRTEITGYEHFREGAPCKLHDNPQLEQRRLELLNEEVAGAASTVVDALRQLQ